MPEYLQEIANHEPVAVASSLPAAPPKWLLHKSILHVE
jgi:hypothetical protein